MREELKGEIIVIKKMDIKEFREIGLLAELNRAFLQERAKSPLLQVWDG